MKHLVTLVGWTVAGGIVIAFVIFPGPLRAAGEDSSCQVCHGGTDYFDEAGREVVERFRKDVHAAAGLGCHDCHGGDPNPALADDLAAAKDETYRGAPRREEIPRFCGRCHSDPVYMRRFDPDLRVDQEREYETSQHGRALVEGNTAVATCVDCHSHHGILGAGDAESPVYPTRVAETCRTCHSDPRRMAGATLPDGRQLPTDQYARWRWSVHAAALHDKGDFSAPTCNDCHGNHGAAPPGVDSIAFVCGQCHGREARLFQASSKREGFEEHNLLVEDLGEGSCGECHEDPEPQTGLTTVTSFSECAICHGNHAVIRPTLAMLGPLPESPCAFCHEGPLSEDVPEPKQKQQRYETAREALFATARERDLEGDALFDWLVDQVLVLPFHTLPASAGNGEGVVLRPELERLFEKFRIGKTSYELDDPDGNGSHRVDVVRCNHCHGDEVVMAAEPLGHLAAEATLVRMRELTALTARAERLLLTARRGGVETRDALAEIEKAVDAQISLEVLLHTFEVGTGSEFAVEHEEGLASARAALRAGREALDELRYRRRGLAVSLIFVFLVALGLALKIRALPSSQSRPPESPAKPPGSERPPPPNRAR